MPIEISALGTFEGDALLNGIAEITDAVDRLSAANEKHSGATKHAAHSWTELHAIVELGEKGLELAKEAIEKVLEVTSEWVKVAASAELTQIRLTAAVGKHAGALREFNEELEKSLGIDVDETAALQTKLAALGVLPSKLEEATKATVGLSSATGKDLLAASKMVAKAFTTNSAEAERLTRLFSIAESTTHTFAVTQKRLSTATEELEKALGTAVTQSEGFKGAMDAITDTLYEFVHIFSNPETRTAIDEFFRLIIGFGASTINTFLGMRSAAIDLTDTLGLTDNAGTLERINKINHDSNERTKKLNKDYGKDFALLPENYSSLDQLNPSIQAIQALADKLQAIGEAPSTAPTHHMRDPLDEDGGFGKSKKDKVKMSPSTSKDLGAFPYALWEQLEEQHLNRMDELRAEHLTIEANAHEQAQKMRDEAHKRQIDSDDNFYAMLVSVGAAGIGAFSSTLVQGLAASNASVGAVVGALLGTIMSGVGQSMVALGTAALTAATATAGIPILWPIFGGPIGVVGATALIVAGGALAAGGHALGSALSGGGNSGSSPSVSRGGGGGRSVPSLGGFGRGDGFTTKPNAPSQTPIVYNLTFSGPMGGSGRRIARDLERVLGDGRTLRPA